LIEATWAQGSVAYFKRKVKGGFFPLARIFCMLIDQIIQNRISFRKIKKEFVVFSGAIKFSARQKLIFPVTCQQASLLEQASTRK